MVNLVDKVMVYIEEAHLEELDCAKSVESVKRSEGDIPLTNDNISNAMGMSVEKVIEIWRSEGAPFIPLGSGENCYDLEKLLK